MRAILMLLSGMLFWAGGLCASQAAPLSPAAEDALNTVVIDAGHGAGDRGAAGAGEVPEKELAQALARKLAREIREKLGWRVILTREGDKHLSWTTRAAIANNNKADLFIALHLNAEPSRQVRGATVYVLSDKSWVTEKPPAPPESGLTHWDFAALKHLSYSTVLAESIEARLAQREGIKSRGVRSAPLLVLKSVDMPGVLIEAGFLSHPGEEERLLKEAYQDRLVEAVFEGVLGFKRYVEKN